MKQRKKPYKRKSKLKIVAIVFVLFIFLFAAAFIFLYRQVVSDADTRIKKGAIRQIIFSESPVFFDDGEEIIGVFFEKTHRKYISYRDIPSFFIKAIVASEDKNFFNHYGFDIRSIIRAFIINIQAGRVVQGGSTLTQQTAKNIFKREKRSYKAKAKELIQALLLERNYSKEEILEIYSNQFFVTGFGSGLRIAAQYFFDKDAEKLDLVESAFIAGSVKGPFWYNPFIKKTEVERNKAISMAKSRKDYVLGNMLKMNFITNEQYEQALKRKVPFKEGRITYRLNVILDYIREQLESDYFRGILLEQGINNTATSGIKIHTSINREIQNGALNSLRANLPLFDVMLNGYGDRKSQEHYKKISGRLSRKSNDSLPFLCRISEINNDKNNPYMMVSWENGGGLIDYEGLKDIANAWLKNRSGSWASLEKRHIPSFLRSFAVGDLLPVKFIEDKKSNGPPRLALSEIPDLEGGIIVLKQGMIKAMVGGFYNHFFNRATDAKRQLGSIFKPLVYTAATQLKWNNLDALSNRSELFQFQTTSYIPKPDHKPDSEKVSMLWAGVKSENIATVWLLYHLTDKLNTSEFSNISKITDMDRKEGETYDSYIRRVRDKNGVVVNRNALMEAAFDEAKKDIEPDLIFNGFEDAIPYLSFLHYEIDTESLNLDHDQKEHFENMSFKKFLSIQSDLKKDIAVINRITNREEFDPSDIKASYKSIINRLYLLKLSENEFRIIYSHKSLQQLGSGQGIGAHKTGGLNLEKMSYQWLADQQEPIAVKSIWLEGLIPAYAIDQIQETIRENFKGYLKLQRYSPEILYKIRDFKVLVNLKYITLLSKKMGISTGLEPVLSFPLGANAISITEAARAYQSIMTGNIYSIDKKSKTGMVPVITKIVDRYDETIWEYESKPEKVFSENTSFSISEILRMVMKKGTGKKEGESVKLAVDFDNKGIEVTEIIVPTFGKTGTSNRYTNSSFAGFIPCIDKDSGKFKLKNGYVIASYVGYDDNRSMKGKYITIYGSSGALPLWIDTANAITGSKEYIKGVQDTDLAFISDGSTFNASDLIETKISPVTGLLSDKKEGEAYPLIRAYARKKGDELILKRIFEPVQGADDEKTIQ